MNEMTKHTSLEPCRIMIVASTDYTHNVALKTGSHVSRVLYNYYLTIIF